MVKLLHLFLGIVLLITPLAEALAANFTVSPLMVDVEAEVRDAFTRDITLTNTHTTHQRLFASVHEITLGEESEIKSFIPASMSDRAVAVTSWIEISRARIDLQPGESTSLPLIIRVNHNTPPGLYHAYIGFAQGRNRDEAEASVLAGTGTGVIVRIAVGGPQEEFLKLVTFTTDRFSILPGDGAVSYTLENSGDVPLTPSGDIIIYDGRGRELTSLSVNDAEEPIVLAPGEKREFSASIPFIERLGRHKAYLSVEYGSTSRAALYDTNFYYSIPWYYLLIIGLLLLTVLVSLILLVRRNAGEMVYEEPEAHDVPLFVGRNREHNQYEHDINLKKTTTDEV